eukprot:469380_1
MAQSHPHPAPSTANPQNPFIKYLQDEVEKYKDLTVDAKVEIRTLQAQFQQQAQRQAQLQQQLKDTRVLNDTLNEEMRKLKEQMNTMTTQNQKYRKVIKSQKIRIDKITKENAKLKSNLNDTRRTTMPTKRTKLKSHPKHKAPNLVLEYTDNDNQDGLFDKDKVNSNGASSNSETEVQQAFGEGRFIVYEGTAEWTSCVPTDNIVIVQPPQQSINWSRVNSDCLVDILSKPFQCTSTQSVNSWIADDKKMITVKTNTTVFDNVSILLEQLGCVQPVVIKGSSSAIIIDKKAKDIIVMDNTALESNPEINTIN